MTYDANDSQNTKLFLVESRMGTLYTRASFTSYVTGGA